MRPSIETVYPSPGYSFCFQSSLNRRLHFNWHRHPEFELLVCRSGGGQAHIGDLVDSFTGPAAYLIGPMVPHGIAGAGSFDGWIVQIPLRCFERIEGRPEFSTLSTLLTRADKGVCFSKPVALIQSRIIEEGEQEGGLRLWLRLVEALDAGAHDKDTKACSYVSCGNNPASGEDRFENLLSRLYDEAVKHHRLADAAAELDMSIPTFCRTFKKKIGMSFIGYLHSIRINSAKKMLLQTKLYIDDICYECGFNNVSFFDRKFKELTGMNPRDYRRCYAGFSSGKSPMGILAPDENEDAVP